MKNIITCILFIFVTNNLPAIEYIADYTTFIKDNGTWIVDMYPDQIILDRFPNEDNNIIIHENDYSSLFDFSEKNIEKTYSKKYNNTQFDVILYKNDIKHNIDNCMIPNKCILLNYYCIDNHKDKLNWNLYYSTFLDKEDIIIQDMKEINNKIFIACNSRYYVYIYVFHYIDKGKKVFDKYEVFPDLRTTQVKSIEILSDNIVKIIRNSGSIDYWKISQSKEDIKNNIKDNSIEIAYQKKLIWSSFWKDIHNSMCDSWDCLIQDTEPTIDQLKEKFPNDTFFEGETGDGDKK